MGALRYWLGLAAVIAIASFPAAASAQSVVPPGNSAVNQYTETYPTPAGGTRAGDRGGRSPGKVLGAKNARKLEAEGAEGQAAATLAAETAPVTAPPAAEGDGKGATRGGGQAAGTGGLAAGTRPQPVGAEADGSSGLGEVIGQATGTSSSGELGLLLPLAILAAAAGSLIYLWRRRRRAA